MSKDFVLLTYILECILNIEDLTKPGDSEISTNRHHRAAILYYLQTLAESTQKLSDSLKAKYPEIDWQGISGFRNRLVHGYLNINFDVVAKVIESELPTLKVVVQRLLNDIGPDTNT